MMGTTTMDMTITATTMRTLTTTISTMTSRTTHHPQPPEEVHQEAEGQPLEEEEVILKELAEEEQREVAEALEEADDLLII